MAAVAMYKRFGENSERKSESNVQICPDGFVPMQKEFTPNVLVFCQEQKMHVEADSKQWKRNPFRHWQATSIGVHRGNFGTRRATLVT